MPSWVVRLVMSHRSSWYAVATVGVFTDQKRPSSTRTCRGMSGITFLNCQVPPIVV